MRVCCYGGKIRTPHIDRLAAEGMRFTDAHSRLFGLHANAVQFTYGTIQLAYETPAQRARRPQPTTYRARPDDTGVTPEGTGISHRLHRQVAPWNGLDREARHDVANLSIESREQVFNVDFEQPIANGPNSVGFDYYYGMARRSTWCRTYSSRMTVSRRCRPRTATSR